MRQPHDEHLPEHESQAPPAEAATAAMPAVPGSEEQLSARYGEHYRWLFLLALMVGAIASLMSATVVNVAIPALSVHFGLDQARAQWVSSAFMVANTVAMLATPWLLCRYGYRRTYIVMVSLLGAGGVVGGMAQDFSLVLLARLMEGVAAGVLQPIPAIIIMYAFPASQQGRASGLFGMGVVLAPALGPSIGGLMVDLWGWRSIFYMVVPLCLLAVWLGLRWVPVTAPGSVAAERGGSFEWRSMVLLACGTVALLNGLIRLHDGAFAAGFGLLFFMLVCCVLFIRRQKRQVRRQRAPLLNLHVFDVRPFSMGCVVAFIYGAALFGSTYLLPMFMMIGLGLPAAQVGLIMLPSGVVLAFTIALAGRLADQFPGPLLIGAGLWALAASFGMMYFIEMESSIGLLVAITVFGRIGLGFILPSLQLAAVRPLPRALISQGASAINFVRMLGGAIGVSLCGIVLEWRVAAHGESLIDNIHGSAGKVLAFGETFLLLGLLCVLAFLASRCLGPGAAQPASP